MSQNPRNVAEVIATFLRDHKVSRVYGLVGGHIQPIWDAVALAGIHIVDTRHEGAAVHMAHAHAELLAEVGVALVTAGPGLTNAITAIANASVSKAPVLVITASPPRPQAGKGAMQELPHSEIVRSVARKVETVTSQVGIGGRLDSALFAALGLDNVPGPALIDVPSDLLEEPVNAFNGLSIGTQRRALHYRFPDPASIGAARNLIARARRPLVISGRPAHTCRDVLGRFLDESGLLYLDTGESRGAISSNHPSYVPAMRSRVLQEADLVITLGRRLDYQLAYGSPAVFRNAATFIRIGNTFEETSENRRGDVEIHSDAGPALAAMIESHSFPDNIDSDWISSIKNENEVRERRFAENVRALPIEADGLMHPLTLVQAVNGRIDDSSIMVADGGDILSFARVGLRAVRTLDCGSLGCLGVGVPFANAAAISCPSRRVIAVIGDGAFGFSAMELSTAARHKAKALFVIANNQGWNIDRHDQLRRYGGHLVGVELADHRYDLLAESLGVYGQVVEDPKDLEAAIDRALDRLPALLNVMVSREPRSPDFNNGLAEVPPYQALRKWNDAEKIRYT
jgi:acetolactate synthase-1/2/3 large subunit